jgi:serine/threonine protein kinase
MSLEQVQGHPLDARSDIFSYGTVLYEMLAGRRAFQGDNPAQTMGAIVKSDPAEVSKVRPILTPALERVVARWVGGPPSEIPARLYRVDIATGRRELVRELAPRDAAGTSGLYCDAVSPDGSTLVFTYFQSLETLYLAEGLR